MIGSKENIVLFVAKSDLAKIFQNYAVIRWQFSREKKSLIKNGGLMEREVKS